MRVLLLQMDPVWQDPKTNREEIERQISKASPPRGAFILNPEMAETGFVPEVAASDDGQGASFAAAMARKFGVWFQHGCVERASDGFGRNMAIVANPEGRIVARYAKIFPFGFGAETRGFRGGATIAPFAVGEARVCPFICYDLRFPEVWRLAALAGSEIFSIGASWPAVRHEAWRALCISRAIENQAFVLGCNRAGRDPTHDYRGGSIVISPQGEVLAEGAASACVLETSLDLKALREWRERFPALRDVRRRFLGRVPTTTCDSSQDKVTTR
ncbi:MAG: hypothetical protein KF724_10120 [Phycisphaeraceae bacterium]|nr:hypothetical protein [Phycisphaeraceae bacterium]